MKFWLCDVNYQKDEQIQKSAGDDDPAKAVTGVFESLGCGV